MHEQQMTTAASRREFLAKAGLGCGALALTDLLHSEGIVGAEQSNPLAERSPHFKPRAKAVIWLFQTGSPSQVDTFDYKPELITSPPPRAPTPGTALLTMASPRGAATAPCNRPRG